MQIPGRKTGKQKSKKIQEQEEIQNIQELNQEQNWIKCKKGRQDKLTTKHRRLIRDGSANNRVNHEGGSTRQRQEVAQAATCGWALQNKTGSNKTEQVKQDVDRDEVGWPKHPRSSFSSLC